MQKGGGKTKFYRAIPLTFGTKKYEKHPEEYPTVSSNILFEIEIDSYEEDEELAAYLDT